MTQNWVNAARRYKEIEAAKPKPAPAPQQERVQADTWRLQAAQIADAGHELERFIKSEEGRAAMELLGAAKRHLIFGEQAEGGYAEVFFIDANGIQKSYEAHGTWTVYTKEKLPEPKISRATSRDAVQAAVWYAQRKPEEVVTWLRSELDKLANAVNK
jgi:hypothetical protein